MNYRVAVVCAGISGLTAAYTLKNSGIETTVFESASFIGGRMSSDTTNGCIIDRGLTQYLIFIQDYINFLMK